MSRRNRRRGRTLVMIAAAVLVEAAATWQRSGRLGGRLVVRCRSGHLFTTIWIPAASAKSLRLGWWRLQYCPVGRHWTFVTPVRQDALTGEERQLAAAHHDVPIP